MALKSVKQKIEEWLPNNLPNQNFVGTTANFNEYRQTWIDRCTSLNSTGLLQSKKNAYGQCQAHFDQHMSGFTAKQYEANATNQQNQEQQIKQLTENMLYVIGAVLFVALIIYLLSSK